MKPFHASGFNRSPSNRLRAGEIMAKPLSTKKVEADTESKKYQNKIRKLKSKILGLQNAKNASLGKRVRLVNAILNSQDLFKAEVIAKYPTTDLSKIFEEINKMPSNHPIYILWTKYLPEIKAAEASLQATDAEIKNIDSAIVSEGADMTTTFAEYNDFFKETIASGVPTESPEEFNKTLLAESVLPVAEETNDMTASIENLQAVSIVNEEANAIVTAYNAEQGTSVGYDPAITQAEARKKLLKWAAIGAGLFLIF